MGRRVIRPKLPKAIVEELEIGSKKPFKNASNAQNADDLTSDPEWDDPTENTFNPENDEEITSESDNTDSDDDTDLPSSDESDNEGDTSNLKEYLAQLNPHYEDSGSRFEEISDDIHGADGLNMPENEYKLPSTKMSLIDLIGSSKDVISKDLVKKLKTIEGNKKLLLDKPLPLSQIAKISRHEAYEQSKKDVSKYQDAVKRNREAEHLIFERKVPDSRLNVSLASIAVDKNTGKQTKLESDIDKILRAANLISEKKIDEVENLERPNMSKEEMLERRNKIRLMRELAFRHDLKAKRIAKIKSKKFRRYERKRRELLDKELQESDQEAEKNEEEDRKLRAQARVTQRYKYMKKLDERKFRASDDEQTDSDDDELDREEALKNHMFGAGDQQDEDEPDSETELEDLKKFYDTDLPKDDAEHGLLNMKFMQRAQEEKRRQNLADLQSIESLESGSQMEASKETSGRMVFRPDSDLHSIESTKENTVDKHLSSEDKVNVESISIIKSDQTKRLKNPFKLSEAGTSKSSVANNSESKKRNPWITLDSSNISDDDDTDNEDRRKRKTPTTMSSIFKTTEKDLLENFEVSGIPDEQQKTLISEVFGGENLEQEFEDKKKKIEKADAPKLIDETRPGWGSWSGPNIRKRKDAPKFLKKVDGIETSKRKDAKLRKVIIEEKNVKKNKTYLVQQIPYPYQTREQYIRAMQLAQGPEWNTQGQFQKNIKPKLIVQKGQIINPIKVD